MTVARAHARAQNPAYRPSLAHFSFRSIAGQDNVRDDEKLDLVSSFVDADGESRVADEAENFAMAHVRLSTEPTTATGCLRVGQVMDDSVKDLRRKIVKTGGDTGILSFGADQIYAQAFRCAGTARPPDPSAAPTIPPPPPGAPPPPPPELAR